MSIGLFNLSTKKNAKTTGFEEGVHYKTIEDGHGIKHKILNFENEELCPREGIIELEPVRKSRRHLNHVSFRVIRDKEMDVLVGIPLGVDPKSKSLLFQKIVIEENESLDLSIPEQAMKWACIKRSHYYLDSPNFQSGTKAPYKAVDKEKEAIKFELERRTKRKAVDIAEALIGKDLEDTALMIGLDPRTMSPRTLWVEVVKFAESKPSDFMKVYDSDTKNELAVLKRGISTGVISQTLDAGINYNGLTLGFNEVEAINYLKKHSATLISIDTLSRKNESDGDASMVTKKEAPIVDEKDAEISRLKKELENANKRAYEATEQALEFTSEAILTQNDPELAELIKEGKKLGVKGIHNMKDKAKMREKIEEKKKLNNN